MSFDSSHIFITARIVSGIKVRVWLALVVQICLFRAASMVFYLSDSLHTSPRIIPMIKVRVWLTLMIRIYAGSSS